MVRGTKKQYYLINCQQKERFEALVQALNVEHLVFHDVKNPWIFLKNSCDISIKVLVEKVDPETGQSQEAEESLASHLTIILQRRAKGWPSGGWWYLGPGRCGTYPQTFEDQVFVFTIDTRNPNNTLKEPSLDTFQNSNILCVRQLGYTRDRQKPLYLAVMVEDFKNKHDSKDLVFKKTFQEGGYMCEAEFRPAGYCREAKRFYPFLRSDYH